MGINLYLPSSDGNKFIPATKVMGMNLILPLSDENKLIPATPGDNDFILAINRINFFLELKQTRISLFVPINATNKFILSNNWQE